MYEIHRVVEETPLDTRWAAAGNGVLFQVCGEGAKAYMRHAVKHVGSEDSFQVTWLVGEIDNVKMYAERDVDGVLHIVMTKQDLSP